METSCIACCYRSVPDCKLSLLKKGLATSPDGVRGFKVFPSITCEIVG